MHIQLDALKFAIWNASLVCGCGAAACLLISAKSFAADLPVKVPLPYRACAGQFELYRECDDPRRATSVRLA